MITNNTSKKELIQQLLDSKSITMEQAYLLLDEQEQPKEKEYIYWPISQPVIPAQPMYPNPLQPWTYPTTPTLPWYISSGGLTVGDGITPLTVGEGPVTSSIVTSYPPGTMMSYTTNCMCTLN